MSRNSLKKSDSSVKEAIAFIEGADSTQTESKPRLQVVDKKKPLTISATKNEAKDLQDLVKKYNSISYSKEAGDNEINRSDLVIAMTSHFMMMDDDLFFKEVNNLLTQ